MHACTRIDTHTCTLIHTHTQQMSGPCTPQYDLIVTNISVFFESRQSADSSNTQNDHFSGGQSDRSECDAGQWILGKWRCAQGERVTVDGQTQDLTGA
jgi:hypothetical protein